MKANTPTTSAHALMTSAVLDWWARWPQWTAVVAFLWSLGYGVAGAMWWAGASWYPFADTTDDRSSASLLEGAPAHVVGPTFVAGGVLGCLAAVLMLLHVRGRLLSGAVLVVGAGTTLMAAVAIPDYTLLAILAMWPVLVVFAFTGVQGSQGDVGDILYWHRVNLVLVFLGGVVWCAATLAYRRRISGSCQHCGRPERGTGARRPPSQTSLLAWGRRCVWLAVVSTIPYDVTRLAWFFGVPVGLSDDLYESLQNPPELLVVGLLLGLLSTSGALLTHGLVAPWGERTPRWLPRWGGRPVPMWLALVPAGMVAASLPSAAVMFANPEISGGFDLANWGVWFPSLFWSLWAVGLGGAAILYYLRRRGICRHCAAARPLERRASGPATTPSSARAAVARERLRA